jgi:vancomycin resistance protein YoaR
MTPPKTVKIRPHRKKILSLLALGLIALPMSVESLDKIEFEEKKSFEMSLGGEIQALNFEDIGITGTQNGLPTFFKNSVMGIDDESYEFNWDKNTTENKIRTLWNLDEPQDAYFIYPRETLYLISEMEGVDINITETVAAMEADYPKLESYIINTTPSDLITSDELEPHYLQVQTLLGRGLQLTIDENVYHFPAQLKDLEWIKTDEGVELTLAESFIQYVIETTAQLHYVAPDHLKILEANLEKPDYANLSGTLSNGRELNKQNTQAQITKAIQSKSADAEGASDEITALVQDETGQELGDFDHLATGRSYFALSIPGRDYNIRKALNEHYNGILIPEGAEFSFNSFIEDFGSSGWRSAYVIFKGELEEQLGGGICQVSTTMYRAALDAGLEIIDQRGHSLYVTYYQEYGDGLDATIYPGAQDLVFKNNTPGPILVLAYDDGFDAYVQFYGTDDGREVTLEGPYTNNNQTEEVVAAMGEDLRYYQIAWKKITQWADGSTEEEWILSEYKSRVKQYDDDLPGTSR